VVYPPVYMRRYPLDLQKNRLILTVGLFSPWKNLELIPEVASKLNEHFVIIGGIYDRFYYSRILELIKKKHVSDRVTVIPNASLKIKYELLQRAKVYFHTQLSEDFGISIVEGMSANCIPIVHDSGGPREYVPKRWRYKNVEEAVQKIEDALRAPIATSKSMRDLSLF